MARIYRTPTDRRIQALNSRARRKAKYHAEKYGTKLKPPVIVPTGLTGSAKLSAIRSLEAFLKHKPISGSKGAPLTKSLFQQYKDLESKVNERNWSTIEKHADIQITPDQTVGQYTETRYGNKFSFEYYKDKKGRRMGKSGEYAPQNKSPKAFQSDRMLKKAIRKLERQVKGNTSRTLWQTNKSRMESMLLGTDEEHLIDQVKKLTLKQRNILMNLTPFMSTIAFITSEKQSERNNEVVIESAQSKAANIIANISKIK